MNALKLQCTVNEIERNMAGLAPYRKPALFNEFLIKGYSAITLSSVPKKNFSELLQAKLCLGTLITLYDDFADRPNQSDPRLLEVLYTLSFGNHVRKRNHPVGSVIDFATSLFAQIETVLSRCPHFGHLREILEFDLMQFYSANKYSSLLTANPSLGNPLENRLYAHHNMGMVLVAMMDLMAVERLEFAELGAMREVFLLGQRMGRIFNVLATRRREVLDGDITGELATYINERDLEIAVLKLRREVADLWERILRFDPRITTFSVKAYLEGLGKVQKLHEVMEGVI